MGGGDLSPEAKKLKLTKSKWELIKLKNISKEIIKKGGGRGTAYGMEENICKWYEWVNIQISKQPIQLNIKKASNMVWKWAEEV